jgi:hypothetical protein
MRYAGWAAGLWLAFSFNAVAADLPPSSLDFGASATVDVTADGHAHVVEMGKVSRLPDVPAMAPFADMIAQRLRERIESWQFVPAMRDGIGVPSRTHLGVSLRGSDDGHGGMSVAIVSASTGGSVTSWNLAPVMKAFMGAPEEIYIVADIHYADDGRIDDVIFTDARKFSGLRFEGRIDRHLEHNLARAFKGWIFDPEIVDGRPIAGHGTLPLWMCMSPACEAAAAALRQSSADNARFASADPAVKLRSAVAGTAL